MVTTTRSSKIKMFLGLSKNSPDQSRKKGGKKEIEILFEGGSNPTAKERKVPPGAPSRERM